MPKTFAPQLVRLLRHIRTYVNRHGAKLQATLSSAEWTALQSIVSEIGTFDGESITEEP